MGKRGSGSGGGGSGGGAKLDTSNLKGSSKQIAYAADILNEHFGLYDSISNYCDKMASYKIDEAKYKAAKKVVKEMKATAIKDVNNSIDSGKVTASLVIDRKKALSNRERIAEVVKRRANLPYSFPL